MEWVNNNTDQRGANHKIGFDGRKRITKEQKEALMAEYDQNWMTARHIFDKLLYLKRLSQ